MKRTILTMLVGVCAMAAGCEWPEVFQDQVCPECEECTVGTIVDDLLGED